MLLRHRQRALTVERLTIARLGHRGDGIAGDPVIYVRRTLPGEVVEGEVLEGRMVAPRILTPSPERVRPPCRHYKSCGGCDLMHASDDFVAGWKVDVVRTALGAHGLEAPVRRIVTSPPRSRRRAVLSGVRTKSGALVGFHGRASASVVAVPGCEVLDPAITAALPLLEALVRAGAPRKGEIRLAVMVSGAGLDVTVSEAKPADRELFTRLVGIAAEAGFARLSWNGETLSAWLSRRLAGCRMRAGRWLVPLAGGPSCTAHAGARSRTHALRRVLSAKRCRGRTGFGWILSLGAGTFSLPLCRMIASRLRSTGDEALLLRARSRLAGSGGSEAVTTETRDLVKTRRPAASPH